jgi:hypothetical protein
MTTMTEVATIGPEQLGGLIPGGASFSPRGDLALLAPWPKNSRSDVRYLFTVRPDGTGLKLGGQQIRGDEFLGWTWDDALLVFDETAGTISRMDVQTGERKVIYPNPKPSPVFRGGSP